MGFLTKKRESFFIMTKSSHFIALLWITFFAALQKIDFKQMFAHFSTAVVYLTIRQYKNLILRYKLPPQDTLQGQSNVWFLKGQALFSFFSFSLSIFSCALSKVS